MNIEWKTIKKIIDHRGKIITIASDDLNFLIQRIYCLTDLNDSPRGFHAHRNLRQLMLCLAGSCRIKLDSGYIETIISVNKDSEGLLIEKMIWHELFEFSSDCVLMFIVSASYDEEDYIRDYHLFKKMVLNDT